MGRKGETRYQLPSFLLVRAPRAGDDCFCVDGASAHVDDELLSRANSLYDAANAKHDKRDTTSSKGGGKGGGKGFNAWPKAGGENNFKGMHGQPHTAPRIVHYVRRQVGPARW